MRLRLHEPAVALTDLAIGVEAGFFALALGRARSGDAARTGREVSLRRWFVVFFAATGLAAIVGAFLHGLLPPDDREAPARVRAWRLSLGSIGVAGLSAWCLAALLALPRASGRRVTRIAAAAHLAYLGAADPYEPAVLRGDSDLSAGRGRSRCGAHSPDAGQGRTCPRVAGPPRPRPDVRRRSRPGPAHRGPSAVVRSQRRRTTPPRRSQWRVSTRLRGGSSASVRTTGRR